MAKLQIKGGFFFGVFFAEKYKLTSKTMKSVKIEARKHVFALLF